MYTPSYIKRQNQYTSGGEYMIDGQEYIGYYNITARGPYTGRVYADKEQPLFVLRTVLNEQSQLYDKLATKNGYTTDLEFDDPVAAQIDITADNIKQGFITRYFIQQRNDKLELKNWINHNLILYQMELLVLILIYIRRLLYDGKLLDLNLI